MKRSKCTVIFQKISDFYDAVIQMSFGCVLVLDPGGIIQSVQSYTDQMPHDPDLGGENWHRAFPPVDTAPVDLEALPLDGPPRQLLTRNGDQGFIRWHLKRLAPTGAPEGSSLVLAAGIDVSSNVALEQQLHHADRLATVGQLAAGLAHEINGPLNNILGCAQLAAKNRDLPEPVYRDLDHIVRFSLHAREVVKKVMLFSRQVPPCYHGVDLNAVIRESLYFTEPLCSKLGVRVDCRLAENLPEIMGDGAQLRQVVVNLVVNAAQAMEAASPEDHAVEIITRDEDRGLVLEIKDNGRGMSPEETAQCFMPFFTTKEADQGTGLGLSVAHGIIQAHRAEIRVHSEPGKGTIFRICFTQQEEKEA